MNLKRLVRKFPLASQIVKKLRTPLGRAYMTLWHSLHGLDRKTVFFSSFVGKSYSDSPRYICEALMKLRPDLKIIWQLNDKASGRDRLPAGIQTVPAHSLQALSAMATAAVIVDNFNRPFYIPKFSDQYYVQTWHGDRGFKKCLYDMENGQAFPDHKYMDLAVAGSDFGERVYRTAFRYKGEVVKLGMPRNDILLNPDKELILRTRKTIGIPDGTRVLMYAPTFRDQNVAYKMVANIDLIRLREELEAVTGEPWICLARGHSNNTGVDAAGAMDVSSYPEMAELLLISDMFITDYSSGISDFMLLNRPLLLYQPDRNTFQQDNRAFYFDMDASPFPIAKSMDELIALVQDLPALAAVCPQLYEFYGANETGNSAALVAKRISDRIPQ